ncbi:unnamed protein product [Nesidiocoris tenuis]|uniref:Uncharacterized protein n=1 Tax=Nesidiocoris tenuis TaxID=355587 RepID=A0A6H5GAH1_9HEMI|nr:unnamed protein product [Nesidiocoris tenuis]
MTIRITSPELLNRCWSIRQFGDLPDSGGNSDIRSSEDISSGYSSTDQLYTEGVLTRSSSVTSARVRGTGARTSIPRRAPLAEDYEEDSEDEYESPMPVGGQSYQNFPISSFHSVLVNSQAQEVLKSHELLPKTEQNPVENQIREKNSLDLPDVDKTGSQCSLLSDNSDGDPDRKGKYNKKLAPPPPPVFLLIVY